MSTLLNRPIAGLTRITAPQATDVLPVGRTDSVNGVSAVVGLTYANLLAALQAAVTTSLTSASTDNTALIEQLKVLLNAQLANNRRQVEQFVSQSMMAGAFVPMEVPSFLGG